MEPQAGRRISPFRVTKRSNDFLRNTTRQGEPGGYLEQIIKDMSHGSLTIDQTGQLVGMLLWPELRTSEDRAAP
jgi:hypothetical protein